MTRAQAGQASPNDDAGDLERQGWTQRDSRYDKRRMKNTTRGEKRRRRRKEQKCSFFLVVSLVVNGT